MADDDLRRLGPGDVVVRHPGQELSGDMTDEDIDDMWGLEPVDADFEEFLKLDLRCVQGAAQLGSLARVVRRQTATQTLQVLSDADRLNADGLRLIGRGAFGR